VSSTTCLLRSCSTHRPQGSSALPGASATLEHVRQDHHCCHEVLRCRELRWGRRASSPSSPPSAILQLCLDSGFAADASHPCRRLLGSDGTTTATGAGPAHLHAAAVCSPGTGTFSGPYFQLMHALIVCLWLYYILIVQGDRRSFRQPGLDSWRRQHPQSPRSLR
jgi:hypothetical protein